MLSVLRLGHRVRRDKRITTHCALTSRAFGVDEMVFTGDKDESIIKSVRDVVKRWGGNFRISYSKKWKDVLFSKRNQDYKIVHLTMYGVQLLDVIPKIRKEKNLLVVVGGEKVPPEIFKEADYNVSVGLQPHSEVAALAVFFHEYFKGKELTRDFNNKKFEKGIKILPQEKGKKVIKNSF